MAKMMGDVCLKTRQALRRQLDSYDRALFGEDCFAFFACGIIIAIWALELVVNMRHGEGWVYVAHLLLVGPLWLVATGLTVFAVGRRLIGKFERSES